MPLVRTQGRKILVCVVLSVLLYIFFFASLKAPPSSPGDRLLSSKRVVTARHNGSSCVIDPRTSERWRSIAALSRITARQLEDRPTKEFCFLRYSLLTCNVSQTPCACSPPSEGSDCFAQPDVAHWFVKPFRESSAHYDILMISVDTLRADYLDLYGYPQPSSPMMKMWVQRKNGIVFANAYSTAAWTRPSHAAMLTGMPPEATGIFDELYWIRAPKLSHYLSRAYTTVGFVNNANLRSDNLRDHEPGEKRFGWSSGWDTYEYALRDLYFSVTQAEHRLGELRKLSKASRKPFFLFVHTNIVHEHYRVSNWSDSYEYVNRIRTTDLRMHKLFENVDFDNTIVLVTADHGDGFWNEHQCHARNRHGGRPHQELVHIPLILWLPSTIRSRYPPTPPVVDRVASHLDIVPSLIEFASLDRNSPSSGPSDQFLEHSPFVGEHLLRLPTHRSLGVVDRTYVIYPGIKQYYDRGHSEGPNPVEMRAELRFPLKRMLFDIPHNLSLERSYHLIDDPREIEDLWELEHTPSLHPLHFAVLDKGSQAFSRNFNISRAAHSHGNRVLVVSSNQLEDAIALASREFNGQAVITHADVYLPEGWQAKLQRQLSLLPHEPSKWVVGIHGVATNGSDVGHYADCNGYHIQHYNSSLIQSSKLYSDLLVASDVDAFNSAILERAILIESGAIRGSGSAWDLLTANVFTWRGYSEC